MDTGYGGGDYSYTGYGAQGGANGGGWMAGGSQTSPGAKRTDREPSIRPVTIKQLLEAESVTGENVEFKIDDADIASVTFVAQLVNTKPSATNIQYRLDDGTGIIEGKQFINNDLRNEMDSGAKAEIPYNAYVRVYGKLREVGSNRVLNVDHIQQVQDMNEISYHMLEAALVHLQAKGAPAVGANGGAAGGYGEQVDTAMFGGNDYVEDKLRMCNDDAKRFFKYLANAGQDSEGLNVTEIARGLKMDLNRCTECSRQLCEVGLIFSTKDEETWAVLESY